MRRQLTVEDKEHRAMTDEDADGAIFPEVHSLECAQAILGIQTKMDELADTVIENEACQSAVKDHAKNWKCFDDGK